MYIRIKPQSLHYRVSQQETQQLLDAQPIIQTFPLAPGHALSYSIEVTNNSSEFAFIAEKNLLQLKVNQQELSSELQGRVSKQGIVIKYSSAETAVTSQTNTSVFLEIDLKRK